MGHFVDADFVPGDLDMRENLHLVSWYWLGNSPTGWYSKVVTISCNFHCRIEVLQAYGIWIYMNLLKELKKKKKKKKKIKY